MLLHQGRQMNQVFAFIRQKEEHFTGKIKKQCVNRYLQIREIYIQFEKTLHSRASPPIRPSSSLASNSLICQQ